MAHVHVHVHIKMTLYTCLLETQVMMINAHQGFIWAKIFERETGGRVALMGHLGDPRGLVWERDVSPPV